MEDVKIRPVHPSYNLKEVLFFNYSIQKYVDTLIIGSNGSVKAHSTLLSENSEVFKNLLVFQQNEQEKIINLPQFSLEVIKVILEYLYRGDSRYFIEIGKEIKKAIRFFFETPLSLDPDECVEVKQIVPIVILSESDGTNTDLDELPQSPVRHIRYGTNKSKQCVTELPIVNTISSKVDSSHKSKKELLQSNIISQSGTSRSRVEGPLPRSLQEVAEKTNQQSVSVEDSTKKSTTTYESFINKKRVLNPFASQEPTAHKDTQALSSQEATTSKDPSIILPVLETSNSPVKRHRTIYESTDDEDDPLNPLNYASNRKSKLRITPTKKTKQRNKTAKINNTGSKKNTKSNKIGSEKTAQSDNSETAQSNKSGFNESGKPQTKIEENLHTKPLKLVQQMCVVCMKEFQNIHTHIYKKHRVVGYRNISCKKCSHYFASKFLCKEHQKNCTG